MLIFMNNMNNGDVWWTSHKVQKYTTSHEVKKGEGYDACTPGKMRKAGTDRGNIGTRGPPPPCVMPSLDSSVLNILSVLSLPSALGVLGVPGVLRITQSGSPGRAPATSVC